MTVSGTVVDVAGCIAGTAGLRYYGSIHHCVNIQEFGENVSADLEAVCGSFLLQLDRFSEDVLPSRGRVLSSDFAPLRLRSRSFSGIPSSSPPGTDYIFFIT